MLSSSILGVETRDFIAGKLTSVVITSSYRTYSICLIDSAFLLLALLRLELLFSGSLMASLCSLILIDSGFSLLCRLLPEYMLPFRMTSLLTAVKLRFVSFMSGSSDMSILVTFTGTSGWFSIGKIVPDFCLGYGAGSGY